MRSASAEESLEAFAHRALLERRRSLMARRQTAEGDAEELLAERETDWEDQATHLSMERAQLALVTTALERLDDGSWGTCVVCGASIAEARLRAVPEAIRCSACTNHS